MKSKQRAAETMVDLAVRFLAEHLETKRKERTVAEYQRLLDRITSPYVPAAIKLLLFTGARLSEVLGLQWNYINMERGEARLPESKTGAKTVHLPSAALAVLDRVEGNPHVIIGQRLGEALVNLEKPWLAIRKAAVLP